MGRVALGPFSAPPGQSPVEQLSHDDLSDRVIWSLGNSGPGVYLHRTWVFAAQETLPKRTTVSVNGLREPRRQDEGTGKNEVESSNHGYSLRVSFI